MAIAWTIWLSIILIQPETHPIIDIGVRPAPYSLEREIVFTIGHVVAFTITTLLWWWALCKRWSWPRALALAMVIALVVGVFTEYMQTFAPDRHPSLGDYLSNCAGILVVAYWLVRRARVSQFPMVENINIQ
jgi:VanZ family protein